MRPKRFISHDVVVSYLDPDLCDLGPVKAECARCSHKVVVRPDRDDSRPTVIRALEMLDELRCAEAVIGPDGHPQPVPA